MGKSAWGFHGVGVGLGRADTALGRYTRLTPNGSWRFPLPLPHQVIEHDGWLYLFSVEKIGQRDGVQLTRVRPDRIEAPASYEYWSGDSTVFSCDPSARRFLVDGTPGQVSIAWNEYLGMYVLVSSSSFWAPREIRFHVARTLFGPWSGPVARLEIPPSRQSKEVALVYCTYLHPELFRDGGRIMVLTYSLQLKDGWDANSEMAEVEIRK